MYRQILSAGTQTASIDIPAEWNGMQVEIIAFPITAQGGNLQARRKQLDAILDKHLIDLSGFKFNRDEANDYE